MLGHDSTVIVHGLRGNVLRSTDGGRTWQAVKTGLQVGLTAAVLTRAGRIVLASQAGHLLVSSDDGASFSPLHVARSQPAAAVTESSDGTLVVAGARGAHPVALP